MSVTVLARELEGLEEKVEKELSTEEKLLQRELQMDFEKAKRLLEQVSGMQWAKHHLLCPAV